LLRRDARDLAHRDHVPWAGGLGDERLALRQIDHLALFVRRARIGRQPDVVAGPALLPQVTCDGKEVRGARRPDGANLFLLSAALTGAALGPAMLGAESPMDPGTHTIEAKARAKLAQRLEEFGCDE